MRRAPWEMVILALQTGAGHCLAKDCRPEQPWNSRPPLNTFRMQEGQPLVPIMILDDSRNTPAGVTLLLESELILRLLTVCIALCRAEGLLTYRNACLIQEGSFRGIASQQCQ